MTRKIPGKIPSVSCQEETDTTENECFADWVPDIKPSFFREKAVRTVAHNTPLHPAELIDSEETWDHALPEIEYQTQIVDTRYFKNGLTQQHLMRTIRKQRWRLQLRIDFHGMNRHECRALFVEVMAHVEEKGLRYIALIHGKGHQSPHKYSILRIYLHRWLREEPRLLAYFPAHPSEGGEGVTLALFKTARQTHDN